MPGISDPGFRLIALAIRHHVPVVPIPGASAFLAALVASGLPTDSFRFSGFLPAKSGQRRKLLESIKDSPRTQVFYEAPHRLLETLADVVEVLGERPPRGRRPRSDEDPRRIPARARRRNSPTTQSPRRRQRRNHAADCESRRGSSCRPTPETVSRRPARTRNHGRREGRRKSRAEESGQRARDWQERSVPRVAKGQVIPTCPPAPSSPPR